MINLLPPKDKQQYIFARRNVHMTHWLISFVFAFLGLLVLGSGGYIYLQRATDNYQHQADALQASLQKQHIAQVQAEVKDISSSLKLSVSVLKQEVLFSKLLEQLATVIPASTKLSALDISQTTGALDITAQAKSYADATQLQINLADPANKIFSKADIVSISCSSNSATPYPCTVTIRALFVANNPFLFINNGGKS